MSLDATGCMEEPIGPVLGREVTPDYYKAKIGGEKADVYAICVAHGITNPAQAHAIKYLIRAGKKPGESFTKACDKAIDAIVRAVEIAEAAQSDFHANDQTEARL